MINDKKLPKINKKALKDVAVKNLKAMQRTRESHPLREESRIIKYGAIGFVRNVWLTLAATLIMTITLVILFVTIVASVVLNDTATAMREKIDITVYFKPQTSQAALDEMSNIIKTDPNIKSVEVATSEDEFKNVMADNQNNEDVLALLKDEEMREIMLKSIQATMRLKVYDIDNIDSIKQIVSTNSLFVKNLETDPEKAPTYDANQAEIHTIISWANIIKNGGIILGVIFLVISILAIFNTIRMAIFSRREEIYMMKLIGADKRFVRGPFLFEAELCGVISGIIAGAISYALYNIVAARLTSFGIDMYNVDIVMRSSKLVLVFVAFIVTGILIGRVSAQFAISKYLRKA